HAHENARALRSRRFLRDHGGEPMLVYFYFERVVRATGIARPQVALVQVDPVERNAIAAFAPVAALLGVFEQAAEAFDRADAAAHVGGRAHMARLAEVEDAHAVAGGKPRLKRCGHRALPAAPAACAPRRPRRAARPFPPTGRSRLRAGACRIPIWHSSRD